MAVCQKCGTQNEAGLMFCAGCGSMISSSDQQTETKTETVVSPEIKTPLDSVEETKTMVCPTCGAINEEGTLLCSSCGKPAFTEIKPVGQESPQETSFYSTEEKDAFCPMCGAPNNQKSNFCAGCGNSFSAQANQATISTQQQYAPPPSSNTNYQQHPNTPVDYGAGQQKSKIVAGLLNIFLGFFGAGRFYLGYTSLGVAQLLVSVFTCGAGAIWGLIDGIMILTGSVKTDAKNIPLKD